MASGRGLSWGSRTLPKRRRPTALSFLSGVAPDAALKNVRRAQATTMIVSERFRFMLGLLSHGRAEDVAAVGNTRPQGLKSVRENLCRPSGTCAVVPLYPALKRWAK